MLPEKSYPKKMWWDQCRYLNRYTPYEARERSVKRSHKDSSQARKGQELPALLWEWTGFHSPHTGASPPCPLHPECYPQEKAAFRADHSGCSLSHRIRGHETMRSRKRRYQSAESTCNGGSTPKKARRSLPRDLEEPNKSKAKHHEREHRCLLDTDLPVVQSDSQPCRYQKKSHSENFGTEPGLHSPKTTTCETVDDVWRPRGSSLLADGLPVEGFGLFQMEKKPLKLDSRTDWCQYGQGD
nr:ubiquitin carboxyl-terminal hydrolase 42-like [Cavia porcellus]